MTGWRLGAERERPAAREPFDPVLEGARHGLSREQSLAAWERARWEADRDGREDAERVQRRFQAIALRIAARGGALRPDVGRLTRVGVELDGEPAPRDELAIRAPGRSHGRALRHAPPQAMVYRDADDGELDADAAAQIAAARATGSQPLPAAIRAPLEAALGVTLDKVRVHDHDDADAAARSLGARAFTIESDIFFRKGLFRTDTRAGQRLIAHEVAHTQQPGGATGGGLRVSAPGDAAEREADRFADAFASVQPLDARHPASTTGGGRDRGEPRAGFPFAVPRSAGMLYRDREPGPRERATRLLIALGADGRASFTLEADGGPPFTAAGTVSGLVAGNYRVAINRARNGLTITNADGSPLPTTTRFDISIPASARGMHTLLRRATAAIPLVVSQGASAGAGGTGASGSVSESRRAIDQLPDHVRRILFTTSGDPALRPQDEPTVLRIGQKLAGLNESELSAFEARTIGATADLSAFEAGVDRYLEEVRRQRAASAETERTRIRLSRLDDVYTRYREYTQLQGRAATLGALGGSSPMAGGTALGMQPTLNRMRDELTAELRRYNFNSIAEFEQALQELLAAVRTEAQLVAREQLDRYEHVLAQEEQRYRQPGAGAELHQQLGGARGHYQRASQIRRDHAQMPWTPAEMEEQAYWSGQFHEAQGQGRAAVSGLSSSHPLLGNGDIPHEELATAGEAQVGPRMLGYIAERRSDVQRTRRNIAGSPDLVFELDTLMNTTFVRLGIPAGSMYRRVVADRNRDRAVDRALVSAALAVLALAAGLVSAGGGAVAVIGGATALGIGAFQAHEEFRRYETMHAAHGAQLVSEDPSFAWVIVALVGVGLDAAAVGSAIRGIRPALTAFNRTSDVAALEAQLAGTEERIRTAVMRSARLEAESRAAWRAVVRPPAALRAVLVPGLEEFGRLVYAIYLSARRGIAHFDLWVRTREAIDLVGDIARLSPEDLTLLKNGYQAAVRDMNAIAAHGQRLGMTEAEIGRTLQRWSSRSGGTADDIMREMTAARSGGARGTGTAVESGTSPRGHATEGTPPRDGVTGPVEQPWTPPRSWNGPVNHGRWEGMRGNSGWIDDRPEVIRVVGRSASGEANPIPFRNGVIDFSRWSQGEITVAGLTGEHANDMTRIRRAIADHFNLAPGRSDSARAQAALDYLRTAPDGFGGTGLRPHHTGGNRIQLVPRDAHKVQHTDLSIYPPGE